MLAATRNRCALVLLLGGLFACSSDAGPSEADLTFHLRGVVRDSAGIGVPRARVVILADGDAAFLAATNADDTGAYEFRLDSLPSVIPSFELSVATPRCYGPVVKDTVSLEELRALTTRDLIAPVPAPHPTPTSPRLCALDHWPEWEDGSMHVILLVDSTQTATSGATTTFGGTWVHETSISAYGWAGTFSATLDASHIQLQVTYRDTAHYNAPVPACLTQTLSAPVLADGRWTPLPSTNPACPLGQQPLLFDVMP